MSQTAGRIADPSNQAFKDKTGKSFLRTRRREQRRRRFESLELRQMLNAAPVANDDAYTVPEDTVLASAISLLANDTDADNDPLSAVLVSGPQHGTLNLKVDGTFTYTPKTDFAGVDTFTYAARDPHGAEDKATATINVIGENEPPTVNNQTFSVAENSPNGTTVGTVVATDPDAGDVLMYALSGGGGGFAIDNAGKITLVNNSQLDFETKATLSLIVTVSDDEGASDTATITIHVTNANDPPTVVAPIADVAVAEESSPTVINISGVFADQDKDALTFSVVSDNPALVTLSISGSELKLTYNADKFGTANITLTANDGKGGTASDTFVASVANVNDPPIAQNDVFFALESKAVSGNVLSNDVDPDGDTLTAFLNSATKNGTLSFQSNGTFIYTPNEKFAGADTFSYTATDGKTSDTATVTINVTTPQNPPDAKDDLFATPHNTPVSGNVLANDIDPDGDKLFANLGSSPANGTVVLNFDGSFSYAPNVGFIGADSFTYKASDGRGGTDTAKVVINVTLPASLDATDDSFTVPEDTVVTGNLLANDLDPEGDKFSITSTTAPSSGSLVIEPSGNFTYTPLANFFGTDTFTYTIEDTTGSSDTAKVTLVFTAVNEVDAINDAFAGKMNTKLTIAAPGVLANDVDPDTNPEHKIAIAGVIPAAGTTSKGGAFAIRADGSFDFTPAFNFSGDDSFTYTIADGAGAKDTATVTINVEHMNIAPDANNDNATVGQDSKANFIAVLANDSDFDGDPVFVSSVTPPANGTVTLVPGDAKSGGGVRYTPNAGFRGFDSFSYTVSDGQGGSDTASVAITVAPPVNPDASDDFFTLAEDTVFSGNLLSNDFDLEGDKLTIVTATAPSSGSLTTDSAGNFSYTPSSNFVGDVTFTYTITDGNGTFDTAKVTLRVTNINDAPDAKDDQATALPDISNKINVLANDIDVDLANPVHSKFNTDPPDALRVIAVGIAANGQVVLGSGGVVSYTPNENFDGVDSFTYTISDRGQDGIAGTADDKTDTAKVTIIVFDSNHGVNARNDNFKVDEDSIRNALDVLKNDFDSGGDAFKVTGVTQSGKGIVEIGTNGANVLYTPDPNFFGTDTFTYTITDRTGFQDTATVTVTVVDVGPDFGGSDGDDVYYIKRDSTGVNIQVFANDTGAGTPIYSVPAATAPALSFDTVAGNDRLIVDAANGNPVPAAGLSFAGGEGNDSLLISASGAAPGDVGLIEYQSGAGENTLTVQNGAARVDSTFAAGGTLDTTIEAGAQLSTARLNQHRLSIAENGRVTLLPDGDTSVITSLTLGTGATLDIADNALVLDYSGDSPVTAVREKILTARPRSGLGEGVWTGPGITSSAAAAANQNENDVRSVGYAENALLPLGAYTTFRGVPVDSTAVLIAYVRTGDANLDGVVDDDDVTVLGAMYAPGVPNAAWALADFDYDGFVEGDDATAIGAYYDPGAMPLAAPAGEVSGRGVSGEWSRVDHELVALLAEAITNDNGFDRQWLIDSGPVRRVVNRPAIARFP